MDLNYRRVEDWNSPTRFDFMPFVLALPATLDEQQ